MALNTCAGCTTKFAVGLARCPHCRSTEFQEDGDMPKITRHGGPSVAGISIGEARWGDGDEEASAGAAGPETVEEESSPGNSSETSSETPSPEPETNETPTPSRARKTASRSKKAPTGDSSAPSTDGGPAADTSATDGEEPAQ